MARPVKCGVDYFSHDTVSGKTIFTLEAQFGNDGYAFWFKLLELLGTQEGLYYDCGNPADWMFLVAKTRVDEETATKILDLLAALAAIDAELWQQKIIWVQKFVDRLAEVFKKRASGIPQKPSFRRGNPAKEEVSYAESTQSKGKERKEKVKESNNAPAREGFDSFWKSYPKKKAKGDAEKAFSKLKPDDLLLKTILEAIKAQARSPDWTKDGGQFIPHPATWLNQRRWEDEVTQPPRAHFERPVENYDHLVFNPFEE